MIVDTSALVAIIQNEDDSAALLHALAASASPTIAAPTLLEARIVVSTKLGNPARRQLDALIKTHRISVEPFTEPLADVAADAFRDYGKGSGHPAQLNFGDCFAYALATERGEPLLFTGQDFVHTDVTPAAR